MRKFLLLTLSVLFSVVAYAQSVTGVVVDGNSDEPLIGATVALVGSTSGTITDIDGSFTLANPDGATQVVVSYIGYQSMTIDVPADGNMGTISISEGLGLEEVVISGVIDIVKDRKTPVAASIITAREIQLKLGNQEFPEILKTTPSIYATKTGGGYGDGRISVRGFTQVNTAVIINGQPVNDMENGRVFWSNWAGLQDVASGVEIQRGIGASKLAVPSVGGTINVITKATEATQGGFAAVGVGNDGYFKTTAGYNTGENSSGLSASILLGRWQGNGYVDGTKGEGYNYLFALGWKPSENHSINASFLGAGQWHHQRSQRLSIRDFQNFGGEGISRRFNGDAGTLNGEEYTFRRNFYNKPIASLNHDWKISDNLTLSTVLYGSWGRGGGTGPRGRNFGIYPFRKDLTAAIEDGNLPFRTPEGQIDYDAIVANNQAGDAYTGSNSTFAGQVLGANDRDAADGINNNIAIRRASVNSHDWYGAISNLEYTNDSWTFGVGLDGRSYSGLHYRVLNDLLGLDAYVSTSNINEPQNFITETSSANPFSNINPEDKLNYYNIGNVSWLGVNGLAEYSNDQFTGVIQAGYSNQSYQREDFFAYSGDEQQSETKSIGGGFVKGGANYNVNSTSNVFFNAGFIARQPFFDAVFPNFGNDPSDEVENEEIVSFELGYGYRGKKLRANVNLYNISWGNRFLSRGVELDGGAFGTVNFSNLKNVHTGVELELDYDVTKEFSLSAMGSVANWTYNGNVTADVFDDNQQKIGESTLFLDGVKVGDAAQTTFSLGADYEFIKGLSADITYLQYANLYADFDVLDSEFQMDNNNGSVKLPSYGLVDFGITYNVNVGDNLLTLRANVNNLLDTEYIAESSTNIHAAAGDPTYNGINTNNLVWFGFGRTWNLSAKYSF